MLGLHHTRSFANEDEVIRFNAGDRFAGAGRPVDLERSSLLQAQTEVQARIVGREIARLAKDGLCLLPGSITSDDAGSNCAPVAPGPFQTHLEPVVCRGRIVAQQRGWARSGS